MKTLEECRLELNEIDSQLIDLINKRLTIVTEVGEYKKAYNLPVYDKSREEAIIERLSKDEKFKGSVKAIYPNIFEFARSLEE